MVKFGKGPEVYLQAFASGDPEQITEAKNFQREWFKAEFGVYPEEIVWKTMKCFLCRNEFGPDEPAERINPWPWDELIVCEQCYDWQAWRFVSNEQILEALREEDVPVHQYVLDRLNEGNIGRSSNW